MPVVVPPTIPANAIHSPLTIGLLSSTPAVLVSGERLGALLVSDQPVAVLSRQSIQVEPPHRLIRMPEAPAAYAAALYGALRAADAGAPALIAIEHPPEGGAEAGLWLAVRDRLLRATGARAANS